MELRPFRPEDTQAVISLIDAVYHEYDDLVHLDQAESDLTDIPAHFEPGHFMVLDDDGAIRGTVALTRHPGDRDACMLKRMYLDPDLRGGGWAEAMLAWAIDKARGLGLARMELWSDTRFARAHRFYTKMGFQHTGRVRTMNDSWRPYQEYLFRRDV